MHEGRTVAAVAVTLKTGLLFWWLVAWRSGGGEPWDADGFWTLVYPLALVISGVLGGVFAFRAWLWGPLVMLMQVPIVVVVSGIGPLLAAGIVYAAVLSVPAALVSWATGAARRRLTAR